MSQDLTLNEDNFAVNSTNLWASNTADDKYSKNYILQVTCLPELGGPDRNYSEFPGISSLENRSITAIRAIGIGNGRGLKAEGGVGVDATGSTGVDATGDSFGVVARLKDAHLPKYSARAAVYACAIESKIGDIGPACGVIGESSAGSGVEGNSVEGSGVSGYSETVGVSGTGLDIGISALGVNKGLVGWGDKIGVQAIATADGGAGLSGSSRKGHAVEGISQLGVAIAGSSPKGLAGRFTGTVVVDGAFIVLDVTRKHGAIAQPDGSHRLVYCVESTESWIEDFGEARLVKGKAIVALPGDLVAIMKRSNKYHVFLTPYGRSEGLYVARRSGDAFEVREQNSGNSSIPFGYRIVAKPAGRVAKRLPRFELPAPINISPAPASSHRRAKKRVAASEKSGVPHL